MANSTIIDIVYCPRCDNSYSGKGPDKKSAKNAAMIKMLQHAKDQHPDMDNEWMKDPEED